MKVENLIKILQEEHKPTDDICVLWWNKPEDFDDKTLSDESWADICLEFDEWQDADTSISEWIADAVLQHSVDEDEA